MIESNLTPREQEILNMLIDGKTPKEIAYELKISYNTVIMHQRNLYRQLKIQNINDILIKHRPIEKAVEVEAALEASKYKASIETDGRKSAVVDFSVPLFDGKFIITMTKIIKENNGQPEESVAVTGMRYEKDGDCTNIYGTCSKPDTSNLTCHEKEIFDMLLAGKTPKEIASKLNVSYHTVIMHKRSIYRKFEVQNINDLIIKFRPSEKAVDMETALEANKRASEFFKDKELSWDEIIKHLNILNAD
jgi:DNA-binding CsgD family transcriptional regulator